MEGAFSGLLKKRGARAFYVQGAAAGISGLI
jgi:hypothetical protein